MHNIGGTILFCLIFLNVHIQTAKISYNIKWVIISNIISYFIIFVFVLLISDVKGVLVWDQYKI